MGGGLLGRGFSQHALILNVGVNLRFTAFYNALALFILSAEEKMKKLKKVLVVFG